MIKTRTLIAAVALTLMGTQATYAMEDKTTLEETSAKFNYHGCCLKFLHLQKNTLVEMKEYTTAEELTGDDEFGNGLTRYLLKGSANTVNRMTKTFSLFVSLNYDEKTNPFAETITVDTLGLTAFTHQNEDQEYPTPEEALGLVEAAIQIIDNEMAAFQG